MKYILQILAGIVFILIGKYFADADLKPHFIAEGIMLLLTIIIVELGYDISLNYKRIMLVIKCRYLALRKQHIRFSMSYQYRIKVRDKYLLVKNSNWNLYQHVGGKYKRLPHSQKILTDFGAIDDLKLQTSGLKKDDLAVFIPAKNAIKFIDWFSSKKDREVSHWREFYEELIDGKGKLLIQKNFPYVNYNFSSTIITPLKKAPGWDCWEILQYDILDLLPTKEQEQELEKLQDLGDSDYIKWADDRLIQCLGYDEHTKKTNYNIGPHAKWVLNMKWSKD